MFILDRVESLPGATISGEINTVIARYQAILDKTELPEFTEREIKIMFNELVDAVGWPAKMIDHLEDLIWENFVDGLTGEVPGRIASLHLKLKSLDYVQKVVLLERMLARQN
jgi:hypothetical protein